MEESEREWTVRARGCVACGTENPRSLAMKPYREDGKVVCELEVPRDFRGYSNVAHGGVTCLILDELMGAAASVEIPDTVIATVRIEARYHRPLLVESAIRGEAWLIRREGRDLRLGARILDREGRTLADGEATFRALSERQGAAFVPPRSEDPARAEAGARENARR